MTSVRILAGLLAMTLLTACGKSLQLKEAAQKTTVNNPTENTDQGTGGSTSPPPPDAWTPVASGINGKVEGSAYNGQLMIHLDSVNQALLIYLPMPLTNGIILPVNAVDIPQLPGASIFLVPQQDGSSQLAVKIPLKYLLKGANLASYNSLPNGDPLPFMPVGQNLGLTLPLPGNSNVTLHFYLAANAAAVFIELPAVTLPPPWNAIQWGFPIRNAARTEVVGYFSFVPNKTTYNSGIYVAGRIPAKFATIIDRLLH